MVRKSIRVVLVAENDLIEVASDPDNFRFVTEVGQGGLPLYRTTEKSSGYVDTVYEGGDISHELGNVAHILHRHESPGRLSNLACAIRPPSDQSN